jgi:hypothetical protein
MLAFNFFQFSELPFNWLYAVMAIFPALFWFVSLLGLIPSKHIDAHHDTDFDIGSMKAITSATKFDLLDISGMKSIPLTLSISLWMFSLGWAGLISNYTIFEWLGLSGWGVTVLTFIALILPTFKLTSFFGKKLHWLFKDYNHAEDAINLVGKIAIVKSNEISPNFGEAVVKLENGNSLTINARVYNNNEQLLPKYGEKLLILEYNPQGNLYYVEKYS